MVVPVRIFHDDLHLGVYFLGGIHHQFLSGIGHQSESVFRPTLVSFGGNLVVVLQVDEEEVVEDEVIEELGGEFRHLFHLLALVLTGIAVSLEVGGFRLRVGDAAAHFKTFSQEELLHLVDGLFGNGKGVAVGFDVDFVEVHLAAHGFPSGFQELVVVHPCHVLCPDVGGNLEVLILSCLDGRYCQHGCRQKNLPEV